MSPGHMTPHLHFISRVLISRPVAHSLLEDFSEGVLFVLSKTKINLSLKT